MANTTHMILPLMVGISNNSQMTNELAVILANKLDAAEMKKLELWLLHAKQLKNSEIQQIKNKSRF